MTMFGLFGRAVSLACKPRLVSSSTASSALSSSSSASSLFHPPPSLSRLPPSSIPAASLTPIFSTTSSFHSLVSTRNRTAASAFLTSSSSLLDAVSPATLGGGIGVSSIRHQTTDFTVRESFEVVQSKRDWTDLERCHRASPKPRRPLKLSPIGYAPHLKGVVLRTLIKKPKKPNSANRKCVLVRLSNGKECVALVPGEGHNLQEHSTVLCEARRSKDLIGVHVRVVRGKYDCAPVKKKI